LRIVRISHSAVVEENRQRDAQLRSRHGHEVTTVGPPAWPEGGALVRAVPTPELPLETVPVHGPRQPNLFWYSPTHLRRVLLERRPDIVDLHEEPFSLAAAGALAVIGRYAPRATLVFYTAQNLPKRYPPPFSVVEQRTFARASCAYPCSREAGDRLALRGFRGGLHVIPLGVTPPPLAPKPPGGLRIGFVGRLEPYKGAELALRAFAAVAPAADVSLTVIGAGSEREALDRQARELGVAGKVHFRGALPQAATLAEMASLHVLLVPSLTTPRWTEQFGRVAAEAMAAGVAVVASDSGALREVVADAGLLVPEGDVDALAQALRSLVSSRDRLDALASAGRERALETFTWPTVADRMHAMYLEAAEIAGGGIVEHR
jgi:glycosyltransferase involved in cell wall biosynthesis